MSVKVYGDGGFVKTIEDATGWRVDDQGFLTAFSVEQEIATFAPTMWSYVERVETTSE